MSTLKHCGSCPIADVCIQSVTPKPCPLDNNEVGTNNNNKR